MSILGEPIALVLALWGSVVLLWLADRAAFRVQRYSVRCRRLRRLRHA